MKITGPASTGRTQAGGGVRRAGSGGFSLGGASEAGEAAKSGAAAPGMAVSALGAMLSIQEDDTAKGRRRQTVDRGNDLLDQLERIRVGLLTGSLSRDVLERLTERLAEARADADDPALAATIGEIELRAAVELAKLEAHSGNRR